MAKKVALWALVVLVATVVGMVVMTALHRASAVVYPMPAGLDPMSSDPAQQAAARAWFASLPAGAFVLAVLAHALGCATGALVATLAVRRQSLIPALVIGGLFTLAGVMNLQSIPHPSWFALVDLPLYLVGAGLTGWLLTRGRQPVAS